MNPISSLKPYIQTRLYKVKRMWVKCRCLWVCLWWNVLRSAFILNSIYVLLHVMKDKNHADNSISTVLTNKSWCTSRNRTKYTYMPFYVKPRLTLCINFVRSLLLPFYHWHESKKSRVFPDELTMNK